MTYVLQANFTAGAATLEGLPPTELPEIAFIGRSNVGKSTLINKLAERKALARTSSTPGRTQEVNLFEVKLREDKKEIVLADLPGFGYAKFSKKKREYLSRLTVEYIQSRKSLKTLCLLNDSRRTPGADELAIRDIVWETGKNLLVIATKTDKLKNNIKTKQLRTLAESYGLEYDDLVLAGEKINIARIWERILLLAE